MKKRLKGFPSRPACSAKRVDVGGRRYEEVVSGECVLQCGGEDGGCEALEEGLPGGRDKACAKDIKRFTFLTLASFVPACVNHLVITSSNQEQESEGPGSTAAVHVQTSLDSARFYVTN
ncbi:hypothetical protein E2C01_042565 [Portunus trituberculatus]|uniref:Uncharacterized protein n=1 Tax=Portunus trituberculatus TaxID=210409 RepID=A0A5B7FQK2_PORTR|nr:hypothetical protein [Portunus trituberculatus]